VVELLARGAQVLVAIGGAYLLAVWFVLIVWTYRDIESRSTSVVTQVVSTLLAVLFFIPGVLLYLLLRPKETLDQAFQKSLEEEYLLQDLEDLPDCPNCHRAVRDDYVLCPNCHAKLRDACANCGKLVDLRWSICPFCAAPQHGAGELAARVEQPAARWVAPSARRRRVAGGNADLRPVTAESGEPAPVAAVAAESVAEPSRPLRPLDRFRGRSVPAVVPDDEASAAADPPSLGTDLLRSMNAYQALGGAEESGPQGATTNGSDLGLGGGTRPDGSGR